MEFEAKSDKEYEVKAMIDSAMYGQQANNNQMLGLYYLVLWKNYPKKYLGAFISNHTSPEADQHLL